MDRGGCTDVPFLADTFDVTLSNFGHVFAPMPSITGAEMTRVTLAGGRFACTTWSPDGLVGRLTDILTDHVSFPDHDPHRHFQWGEPAFVRDELEADCEVSFDR